MSSEPGIWRGWAKLEAEKTSVAVPQYVEKYCHPDCTGSDVNKSWRMLLGLERELRALAFGERLPREIMGHPTASNEEAWSYLERQANHWAAILAWGPANVAV